MISSVFGIGKVPFDQNEEGEAETVTVVYVSDKETWEKSGHCCDQYKDDSFEALVGLGFEELMEAVWEVSDTTLSDDEIIGRMKDVGFEYSPSFEVFMKNTLSE